MNERSSDATRKRPHVVVVGAGFGGLEATQRLARLPVRVTLLDRHNYHTFTPLLYQVATAGLEPEEIAKPVRSILRGRRNARFRVAEVQSVDLTARRLHSSEGDLDYDYLILAAGSTNSFFGLPGVAAGAIGLKDVEEAMALRNHILARFEDAVWEQDADRRRALLTFVVVGGGPTGVEFSGALAELIAHVLPHDYPDQNLGDARVVLLEASDHLLGMFAPSLQRAAQRALRERGVEVRLNCAVERLDGESLQLHGGERIEAATVMWAAGVRAEDLAAQVGAAQGRAGRVSVLPTLQLEGHPEVYAIGDFAGAHDERGDPLPQVAPVAIQAAAAAVTNIARALAGQPPLPFRYRDKGVMATIGRKEAIAQVGPLRLSGFLAWLAWLGLHIVELIGFRNRVFVLLDWGWNYFTWDRAVRLILGPTTDPRSRRER
jgi:NADH:ubiquinone reductase (H+-translocating)